MYDDTAAIGKLYRRQDEIGTPWCVTVDVESLEDGAVTIRDRDAMTQERVPVEGVKRAILDRLAAAAADATRHRRRATRDVGGVRAVHGKPTSATTAGTTEATTSRRSSRSRRRERFVWAVHCRWHAASRTGAIRGHAPRPAGRARARSSPAAMSDPSSGRERRDPRAGDGPRAARARRRPIRLGSGATRVSSYWIRGAPDAAGVERRPWLRGARSAVRSMPPPARVVHGKANDRVDRSGGRSFLRFEPCGRSPSGDRARAGRCRGEEELARSPPRGAWTPTERAPP